MKKTIQALLFVACMCGVGAVKAEERDAASVCYGAFAGLIDVKQDLMEQNPSMGDKVTLQAEIEMYRDAMLQIVPEPQMFYDLNEADRLYGQDNFDDLDIMDQCGVLYLGGDGEDPSIAAVEEEAKQFDEAVGVQLSICAGILDVGSNYVQASERKTALEVVQRLYDAGKAVIGEDRAYDLYKDAHKRASMYGIKDVVPELRRCSAMGQHAREILEAQQ